MKFVWSKKHNFFHWLIVILIRIVYFLVAVPLTIYPIAVGSCFFEKAINPFPPSIIFRIINSFFFSFLPFFSRIDVFIEQQRYIWARTPTWWAVVIALPLIAIGSSFFLINFFNLFLALFDYQYNRTHCPFCKQALSIQEE